jgi:hypothetical protein
MANGFLDGKRLITSFTDCSYKITLFWIFIMITSYFRQTIFDPQRIIIIVTHVFLTTWIIFTGLNGCGADIAKMCERLFRNIIQTS